MIKISPSILAANPLCFGTEMEKLISSGADELHFDVMDGHFVPNITFGSGLLKAIHAQFSVFCDVHLMISKPLQYAEEFAKAGADLITLHVEAEDVEPALRAIRAQGVKAGISLRPGTPVETLTPYLPLTDRVLLMTVEPGFGGQKLIEAVLQKAVWLRKSGYTGSIEADGGWNEGNMAMAKEVGIDTLVMGTGFFRHADPAQLVAAAHAL